MKLSKVFLKYIIILIIIVVFIIYYTLTNLPKNMKQYGLKNVLSYNNYKTMIELKYNKGPDFAIAIDKNNKVLSRICLNKQSIVISNLDIENKNYKDAINTILNKLYDEDKLTTDKITIIEYDKYNLTNKSINIIKKFYNKHNIKIKIIKKKGNLKNKAKKLKIPANSNRSLLINLSIYSAELIKDSKEEKYYLTKEQARKYADIIYEKLIKYQTTNNIINQDKNNQTIKITDIPATTNYYPDSNSWYYIKNSKVYAYIEFVDNNRTYSFCYKEKDNIKEGKC